MHAAALALVLFLHFWGDAERHKFEARVAALKASGQPVRYEDLETPAVPDDENGAKALAKAAQMLVERKGTEPFSFAFGPSPDRLEAETAEEREGRRAWLRSLRPYFDLLAEAPKRPRWHVDHEWKKGPEHELPELGLLQEATTYLHWKVALDPEGMGWAECAADATILVMDLGERCRVPFVLGDLVSHVPSSSYPAIFLRTACGSPSISRTVQPGFDASLFRRLMDPRLAKAKPARGPRRAAFAEERVFTLWAVGAFRAGGRTVLDQHVPMQGALLKAPVWRPFLYRDANRALDLFEDAIALAETSPEESLQAARRIEAKYATKDPTLFLTRWALPALTRAFEKHAESVAVERLTRVVMALLEYRQEKGAWPETLDAIGEMPLDPYAGKPFRYEHLETCYARIRAGKEIVNRRTGQRLGEWEEWERLEWDHLAWTFADKK